MRSSFVALASLLSSRAVADFYNILSNPNNRWNPQTTVEVPHSAEFNNATARWNTFVQPGFTTAISPATELDVAKAVALATSNDVPLLGTGGRHAFSTSLGQIQNGLAIDLSKLKSVKVDAAAGTLTVGGGARFSDVYDPVYNAGFEFPVGSCACPGVVGATIGGGVGRWQGVHGLIIDSLVSVNIVIANGSLITVSQASNPDLFWAIRGAGSNFGIITSATYKLSQQINNAKMMTADFIIPASQNASYFDLVQSLQTSMPAELATIHIMMYNSTTNEPQILANWVYLGPESKGRTLIAPILRLKPTLVDIQTVAYNQIVRVALRGLDTDLCSLGSVSSGYGVNYRNLSSSTFQQVFRKMGDFYIEYPDGRESTVEMEIFSPAAVQRVPVGATAYPWRDTRGYALLSATFGSQATLAAGEALMEEIRTDFVDTGGYDGLAVYASYAHGDETPQQLFGIAVSRLTKLKKVWDRTGVFNFLHAVPTH